MSGISQMWKTEKGAILRSYHFPVYHKRVIVALPYKIYRNNLVEFRLRYVRSRKLCEIYDMCRKFRSLSASFSKATVISLAFIESTTIYSGY